jgi:cytochrome P450
MLPHYAILERLPFGTVRRFEAARERLDATIYRIIRERRESTVDRGDLLSLLLQAQDVEGGTGSMTDQQVRDECMTMFLAGHETTANALAWTGYLLSQHSAVQQRAQHEVDMVLAGRPPQGADYRDLRYVEQVLTESMRLFPPAWMIDRRVVDKYEVGGYTLPADSIVVVSPYVIQRDPRFFDDPARFDPDRWTDEARSARPRYSYFPFGAGTRQCIGEGFARMSAVLVLATILGRWTLLPAADQRADMLPMVTLRPRYGIRVIPRARR